jgi:hypothetical protein
LQIYRIFVVPTVATNSKYHCPSRSIGLEEGAYRFFIKVSIQSCNIPSNGIFHGILFEKAVVIDGELFS